MISIALVAATTFCASVAQSQTSTKPRPKTDAQLIASARSAAPAAISRDATVVTMEGEKLRVLRQGKGEFTCMPDDPTTPGEDPMCLDRNGMEWLHAWMDHKEPPKGKIGLVYMLRG